MKLASEQRKTAVDVNIGDQGSIVMFTLNTDAAKDWVEDNVHTEGWQWMGRSLCVEHRYGEALKRGMEDAGLSIG